MPEQQALPLPTPTDASARYATDAVIGLLSTETQVADLLQELAAGGIGAARIRVTCGPAAAANRRVGGGRGGLLGWLRYVARRMGFRGDGLARKAGNEQDCPDGRRVVAVGVPDRASKDTVSRLLRAHGGRFIDIFGRFAVYHLSR
jgi:hypothetical protein